MLSKSAIEGFLVEPSASVDTSGTQTTSDESKAVFGEVLSMFTYRDKTQTVRKH